LGKGAGDVVLLNLPVIPGRWRRRNPAFPYSPSDFKGGGICRVSAYHLMEVDDPCEIFRLELLYI